MYEDYEPVINTNETSYVSDCAPTPESIKKMIEADGPWWFIIVAFKDRYSYLGKQENVYSELAHITFEDCKKEDYTDEHDLLHRFI